MTHLTSICLLRRGLLAAALAATTALAADWPAWRGPAGNGSTPAAGFPTQWTRDTVTWKRPLPGKGTSTPIVQGGRVFLTSPADGEDAVLAFDLTGKELWRVKLGPESPPKHRTLGSSCNASPVTDGTGLFVYFKSGTLAALELDGTVRWKANLTERFGAERLFWDQGSSPVLTDRHVVVTRLHQGESWVAGFDKAT
ncbi:MAG TPA: PQQ-binding-like beta-propeller repeat protein, partial [Verrucomicrobiota bacterium]|nr:PQQ-binding-like beta-propeller repeat protein [Verrucomicrobiota bacterium]